VKSARFTPSKGQGPGLRIVQPLQRQKKSATFFGTTKISLVPAFFTTITNSMPKWEYREGEY
jgi:hypothetical protein